MLSDDRARSSQFLREQTGRVVSSEKKEKKNAKFTAEVTKL